MNDAELQSKQQVLKMADELKASAAKAGITTDTYIYNKLTKAGVSHEDAAAWVVAARQSNADPSVIVPTLNSFLLKQQVETNLIDYLAYLPVRVEFQTVQNGQYQIVYQYNSETGSLRGNEAITLDTWNPDLQYPYAEVWKCNKAISKFIKVLSLSLNDVAKTPELFYAMMLDVAYKLLQPIKRTLYKLSLQIIANPLGDFTKQAVDTTIDVSTVPPDITIDAKNGLPDLAVQLNNLAATYRQPGLNILTGKYRPNGFPADAPFEYNPSRGEVVAVFPKELINDYKINLQAGSFNIGEVMIPMNVSMVDYKATFEDYGGVKGLLHDSEKGEYDIFIMQEGAFGGMTWYTGSKQVTLPMLYDIQSQFVSVGVYFNKHYLYQKVRIKLTKPAINGGGKA